MNSKFWVGLSMMGLQSVGIFIYLLTKLDYSWITKELIIGSIIASCFGLFSILSIILLIVGIFEKDE